MERKRRFQTRQQYAEQKIKQTKFQKADKSLNYLIAIVAVLIVATLIFIISREPASNEAQQEEPPANLAAGESEATEDEQTAEEGQDVKEEGEDASNEADPLPEETEDTVSPSDTAAVQKVITNSNWPVYPTAQTGEHVSTFEKGHIDYEEKLKAIFSVIELEQENSIVVRVNNNGNAKSAIAVVTSMDKEQKYRVSIEWIDNEGWKPIQVEVLNTLEGV
ncbi:MULTISPECIES: YrrS family protein [Solibacillus]|uniref:DUF1510 family protein n=1 Tax=Solibacillus merdavium TaxID=2762218 RepID=A0ABR8XJF6_9BACL|nr:YrrS family protein [Solibacillus merdavium]MBD8032064.1 DUF1510 family protein [Solibacillus merdavium]